MIYQRKKPRSDSLDLIFTTQCYKNSVIQEKSGEGEKLETFNPWTELKEDLEPRSPVDSRKI